ncbi:MAG: hypothetical protein U1A77_11220 [Pirellulales bacterium]
MNQKLPAYLSPADPSSILVDGTRNWSSGSLPLVYQGKSADHRSHREHR